MLTTEQIEIINKLKSWRDDWQAEAEKQNEHMRLLLLGRVDGINVILGCEGWE